MHGHRPEPHPPIIPGGSPMTHSITIKDGSSNLFDADITDPELVKQLVAAIKQLNKRQIVLNQLSRAADIAFDDEDIERLFVNGFTTMVNHVVTNGPQQRSLTAPTAAPAAVAPPAVVQDWCVGVRCRCAGRAARGGSWDRRTAAPTTWPA